MWNAVKTRSTKRYETSGLSWVENKECSMCKHCKKINKPDCRADKDIILFCGSPWDSNEVSLAVQKPFNIMQSHSSTVDLNAYAPRILFRKSFPVPINWSTFPTFSSNGFWVPDLIPRSWGHLEFLVGWEIRIWFCSLICSGPVSPASFIEDIWRYCLFCNVYFGPCCYKPVAVGAWACFWVLNSIPSISMSVFMLVPGVVTSAFNYSILFWISWSFVLPYEFWGYLFSFCEEVHWDLMEIALNLWVDVDKNRRKVLCTVHLVLNCIVIKKSSFCTGKEDLGFRVETNSSIIQ